jgi:acyl dehydratase
VPLDQSFIGRTYPPTEPYEVSREKIREFASSIGDDNPLYVDPAAAREAGHADVIAPPTFSTIVNLKAVEVLINDPELGMDYGRMVHGEQTFTLHRPVTAGDRLVVVTHVDDISSRMGNDFMTVRAEITTEDGEQVVTTWAQFVVREAE